MADFGAVTATCRRCLPKTSLMAYTSVTSSSGVPAEDVTEVYAIKEVFGKQRRQVAVTAPKSAIGHLLGAATPVDVAIAVYTMVRKEIPPTATLDEPAPGFDLDFVQHRPRKVAACHHSLVVSRGLGGVNACLVVSACLRSR